MECKISNHLKIYSQSVQFLQHKVNVIFRAGLVTDDGSEEVGFIIQRLVADHEVASVHHPSLEFRSHLPQLLLPRIIMINISQPLWYVPETEVHQLRILLDDVEPVPQLLHPLQLVLSQLHDSVHLHLKSLASLGSPGQPELENIIVSPTLNHLQSSNQIK